MYTTDVDAQQILQAACERLPDGTEGNCRPCNVEIIRLREGQSLEDQVMRRSEAQLGEIEQPTRNTSSSDTVQAREITPAACQEAGISPGYTAGDTPHDNETMADHFAVPVESSQQEEV